MDSAAFKLIEQYDVIEIYSKDGGTRIGPVLKDSDNRILVAGIYKTVFGREKGFYRTVGPADVIRIKKRYNESGESDTGAIMTHVKNARNQLDSALALTE